jgi:cysteine desulfurase family protein
MIPYHGFDDRLNDRISGVWKPYGMERMRNMIYLDNAASSFPKPPEVIQAMKECMEEYSANPGRGSHALALRAARSILQARQAIARMFGIQSPDDVIFTQNATEALNLAIQGYLHSKRGHVITTALEHNSVRRPLEYMRREFGIDITYLVPDANGSIPPERILESIRPDTCLIVSTHASNLTGALLEIEMIGKIAKEHDIPFLVDASQTAGIFEIDVGKMNIQMLASAGHKSLYGPQGTGFLYVHPDIDLKPLMYGGTGGFSERLDQPPVRPDRYESGTRNTVGIVGLLAGIEFVNRQGISTIREHEMRLTEKILEGLLELPKVRMLGPERHLPRAPVVSFVLDGLDSAEVGFILDKYYQIAVRTGLHCTPLAHEISGTIDTGAIRVSVGFFNTDQHIDTFLQAISEIIQEA